MNDPGVNDVHSSLWKSIPVYNSAGNKAEVVNVSAGIKRDILFSMHVSSFPGESYERIQRQPAPYQ